MMEVGTYRGKSCGSDVMIYGSKVKKGTSTYIYTEDEEFIWIDAQTYTGSQEGGYLLNNELKTYLHLEINRIMSSRRKEDKKIK